MNSPKLLPHHLLSTDAPPKFTVGECQSGRAELPTIAELVSKQMFSQRWSMGAIMGRWMQPVGYIQPALEAFIRMIEIFDSSMHEGDKRHERIMRFMSRDCWALHLTLEQLAHVAEYVRIHPGVNDGEYPTKSLIGIKSDPDASIRQAMDCRHRHILKEREAAKRLHFHTQGKRNIEQGSGLPEWVGVEHQGEVQQRGTCAGNCCDLSGPITSRRAIRGCPPWPESIPELHDVPPVVGNPEWDNARLPREYDGQAWMAANYPETGGEYGIKVDEPKGRSLADFIRDHNPMLDSYIMLHTVQPGPRYMGTDLVQPRRPGRTTMALDLETGNRPFEASQVPSPTGRISSPQMPDLQSLLRESGLGRRVTELLQQRASSHVQREINALSRAARFAMIYGSPSPISDRALRQLHTEEVRWAPTETDNYLLDNYELDNGEPELREALRHIYHRGVQGLFTNAAPMMNQRCRDAQQAIREAFHILHSRAGEAYELQALALAFLDGLRSYQTDTPDPWAVPPSRLLQRAGYRLTPLQENRNMDGPDAQQTDWGSSLPPYLEDRARLVEYRPQYQETVGMDGRTQRIVIADQGPAHIIAESLNIEFGDYATLRREWSDGTVEEIRILPQDLAAVQRAMNR